MSFIQLDSHPFARLRGWHKKRRPAGLLSCLLCLMKSVRLDELQGVWTAVGHQHQAVHASLCPTQIECGAECA